MKNRLTAVPQSLRWLFTCLLGGLLSVLALPSVAAEPALEMGVLPNMSARVLMTQYEPMQHYLTTNLGVGVQVSTASNWREFYQRLKQGDYQVAVAAGNVARLAEKDLGYVPLVSYEPQVPALLVTRKGVTTPPLKLLTGSTLAMANPASLVVFEGIRWLEQQGLVAGKQFQTLIVRADDSVGNAILRGEAAAGVMSMGEFKAHPLEVRDQLFIHTQFSEVISFLVIANPKLDPAVADKLKKLLLGFDQREKDGRVFFERSGFKGIGPINPVAMLRLDAYLDKTRALLD